MGLPQKEENEIFFPLIDPVSEMGKTIAFALRVIVPLAVVAYSVHHFTQNKIYSWAAGITVTLLFNFFKARTFLKTQRYRKKAGLRELILTKTGMYVLAECVSLDIDVEHKSFLEGADSPWYFFGWQDVAEWSFVSEKNRHYYRVRLRNQEDIRIKRRPDIDQPVVQALKSHAPRVVVQTNEQ